MPKRAVTRLGYPTITKRAMTEDFHATWVQVIGRRSAIYGPTVRLVFFAGDVAVAVVNLPADTARTVANDIENVCDKLDLAA